MNSFHFTVIYWENNPGKAIDVDILKKVPMLSDEHAMTLVRDILDQEIKYALFSIGDDKSLGPDGYTSRFFKKSWSIVEITHN